MRAIGVMSYAVWISVLLSSAPGNAVAANDSTACVGEPRFPSQTALVPDAKTAIAIAVAIWAPLYGKEKIESEQPYNAELRQDNWTVTGTLSPHFLGGVAKVVIAKSDARVILVEHGK
ncbi:MAG: NTF2 fold immunity protein [Pseudomonadota bacterium]